MTNANFLIGNFETQQSQTLLDASRCLREPASSGQVQTSMQAVSGNIALAGSLCLYLSLKSRLCDSDRVNE